MSSSENSILLLGFPSSSSKCFVQLRKGKEISTQTKAGDSHPIPYNPLSLDLFKPPSEFIRPYQKSFPVVFASYPTQPSS